MAGPDRSLRGTHQASFIAQARHPENEGERVMPLILKNKHDRFALQFGARSALRSTSELVDQLQEQLRNERAQHRFNLVEKEGSWSYAS